jgi:Fe-S oxidoreductase
MEEHEGRRINQMRVEHAMAVKPDVLASACPFCLTMFEDGVKGKEVDQDAGHRRARGGDGHMKALLLLLPNLAV